MRLYLLRHAQAEERIDGLDHPERRLTPKGLRQAATMGAFARRQGLRLDLVLTSPYQRATETAAHFLSAYGRPVPLRHAHWLAIDTPTTLWREHISALAQQHGALLLVGHEPDLSAALASLLGSQRAEAYRVRKGSLTCLDITPEAIDQAQLQWSIPPDLWMP